MTDQRRRHGAQRSPKPPPRSTSHAPRTTNWEKSGGLRRKLQRRKKQLSGGSRAPGSAKKASARTAAVQRRTGSSKSRSASAARQAVSSPAGGFPRRCKALQSSGRSKKVAGSALQEESASLDEELLAFAKFVALSPQERKFRASAFEDVREVIASAFEDATVQLYGSSSTGLDTFRSDLDITVGNITLSSSQRLPARMAAEVASKSESTSHLEGHGDEEDAEGDGEIHEESVSSTETPEEEEEETSFSLNLALPVDVAPSAADKNITLRVLPTPNSHWNPTLRRRKIRVLRALQFLLKSQRPHLQVKCLHKAKTPILMVLDTRTHLAMDIGVNREAFEASDHGRSTSLAQRLHQTLGEPFIAVVVFLKEFLHQFELDKPFTGGLGSFRLYLMVAYVFQRGSGRHINACKSRPSVSSLLLTFLELFGNKKTPNFLHEHTRLPLPFADESGNDSGVDFGGVFRLADCVDTFGMAFDILSTTGKLGSIIYEERLETDRARCRKASRLQS